MRAKGDLTPYQRKQLFLSLLLAYYMVSEFCTLFVTSETLQWARLFYAIVMWCGFVISSQQLVASWQSHCLRQLKKEQQNDQPVATVDEWSPGVLWLLRVLWPVALLPITLFLPQ